MNLGYRFTLWMYNRLWRIFGKYFRVFIQKYTFKLSLISGIRFQVGNIDNSILNIFSFLVYFLNFGDYWLCRRLWRFFVSTRPLTSLSIVLLDIVVKLKQILLYLQLFTNFNCQLHALFHLMLAFFLFHKSVDLHRMSFLMPLHLFFIQRFLSSLISENLSCACLIYL